MIDPVLRIARYLRADRVHPGLVFSGPSSTRTLAAARGLAAMLFCQGNAGDGKGCGQCSSCRKLDHGSHPDFLLMARGEESEPIKIETIREILAAFETAPSEARFRLAVFDEAQRLTESAANALLKMLEEPGQGRGFWFLTTQPNALLGTIRSRCLEFRFPPDQDDLADEPTEEDRAAYEAAVASAVAIKAPYPVTDVVATKEQGAKFLRWWLGVLRNKTIGENAPASLAAWDDVVTLNAFQGAVELEGKLRSNANFPLLLGSYLRRTIPL